MEELNLELSLDKKLSLELNLIKELCLIDKIKIYLYDLKNYEKNKHKLKDKQLFPEPYFTKEESEILLIHLHSNKINLQVLQGEICTSHILFPMISKTFGIEKGFEKEKKFQKLYKDFWNKKK